MSDDLWILLCKKIPIFSQPICSQREGFDSVKSKMKVHLHALAYLQCSCIIVYKSPMYIAFGDNKLPAVPIWDYNRIGQSSSLQLYSPRFTVYNRPSMIPNGGKSYPQFSVSVWCYWLICSRIYCDPFNSSASRPLIYALPIMSSIKSRWEALRSLQFRIC